MACPVGLSITAQETDAPLTAGSSDYVKSTYIVLVISEGGINGNALFS